MFVTSCVFIFYISNSISLETLPPKSNFIQNHTWCILKHSGRIWMTKHRLSILSPMYSALKGNLWLKLWWINGYWFLIFAIVSFFQFLKVNSDKIEPIPVGTEPLNVCVITKADTPHTKRKRPRLMFLVIRIRSSVCAIYFHRGLLEVKNCKRERRERERLGLNVPQMCSWGKLKGLKSKFFF